MRSLCTIKHIRQIRQRRQTALQETMTMLAALATLAGAAALPAAAQDAGAAALPEDFARAYRPLSETERKSFELGREVFTRQWSPGAAGATGDTATGHGPLFNAESCDACHNQGARGRRPAGDGPVPAALVMQLGSSPLVADVIGLGDPIYGFVLNTHALPGMAAEATVEVHYAKIAGRYPDGRRWQLRRPQYRVSALAYGPLAQSTVLRPRLAPQIYGVGLLEEARVRVNAQPTDVQPLFAWGGSDPSGRGGAMSGRFGWQSRSASIDEQTARAFSREMGLTTADLRVDDCTPSQPECLRRTPAAKPAVADALWDALLVFERLLAVPQAPAGAQSRGGGSGRKLFAQSGCAGCHEPALPLVPSAAPTGGTPQIQAYTDLQLHDMGKDLADHSVGGEVVPGAWRTSPLWGIGHAVQSGPGAGFLHDGRARTVEEAILWHGGEGAQARQRFAALPAKQRAQLLQWIESL